MKAKLESSRNAPPTVSKQSGIKLSARTVVSTSPLVVQTSMGTIRLMQVREGNDDIDGPELSERYKVLVGKNIETAERLYMHHM